MTKKLLILLSLFFCILFVSTVCFATADINNIGNTVRDGIQSTEDSLENTFRMNNNTDRTNADNASSITDTNTDVNNVGGQTTTDYTATRTAADDATGATTGFMGSTAWTWIVLAIVAIIVIALVWYYANQNTNTRNDQ